MCRFAAYFGPTITLDHLITRPVNSLIHQSFESQEREEPLNGDGFGVSWYVPELSDAPATFRSITPAWNNMNLLNLARLTRSGAVFAHIRAASPGLPVTETNSHPFTFGRWTFMHNGYIAGFHKVRRSLQADLSDDAYGLIQGTTDSETAFAIFIDYYQALTGPHDTSRIRQAIERTIAHIVDVTQAAGITDASQLNLAVTDGRQAVVSRFVSNTNQEANSLYVHQGKRYTCIDGICRMVDPDAEGAAVLVTSERLSDDPGWDRVPPNHIVEVAANHRVDMSAIAQT
jgi:glutamine amidotransferase